MNLSSYNPFSIAFVKKVLRENGIYLSRSRGQNFLVDKNIAIKIVSFLPQDVAVLEIGPGLGCLTHLIVGQNRVYAIELDHKIFEVLKQNLYSKNLFLIEGDFLKFDLSSLNEDELFLLSNLPYSIAGEVIKRIIEESRIREGILMLQKEFLERMLSEGGKNFGVLSILSRVFLEIEKLFEVSKNCFFPRPSIDSVVVKFRKNESIYDQKELARFIKTGFSKRRKTIYNNLKSIGFLEEDLKKLNVEPIKRPEEIKLEQWLTLFEYYQSRKSQV